MSESQMNAQGMSSRSQDNIIPLEEVPLVAQLPADIPTYEQTCDIEPPKNVSNDGFYLLTYL